MNRFSKKEIFSIIIILLIIISLPLALFAVRTYQNLRGRASFVQPNIVVDTGKNLGALSYPWRALAQGGEVAENGDPVLFSDIRPYITSLKPRFIRIDHIYDIYTVTKETSDGRLSTDFTLLDKVVDDILLTGATPFLSLSYFPPAISKEGDIIGLPKDWGLWQEVVRKTVEHYSGKKYRNLQNVYYEIWNEPDLFGNFRMGGQKDYRLLYRFGVLGAISVNDVNNFYIGGPGTTHVIDSWFKDFLSYTQSEKLRLDFLSWHRYTFYPSEIITETDRVNSMLIYYPSLINIQKFITEWGPDSEMNPAYDSMTGAYYTLSAATYLPGKIDGIFSFEIKDGPSVSGKQFWGRWGLFTNEKYGLVAKPRYKALEFLNNLTGDRLFVSGEGTFVRALSTKNGDTYQTLLVNYVPPNNSINKNDNNVPITFKDLPRGIYSYQLTNVFNNKEESSSEKIMGGVLGKIISLPANNAVFITLKKQGELANFETGRFGTNDLALSFDEVTPKLTFSTEKFSTESGTIEFWTKLTMPASSFKEEEFFSLPTSSSYWLIAKKHHAPSGFGTMLSFGFFDRDKPISIASVPITSWSENEWHHIAFSWDTTLGDESFLRIYIDGRLSSEVLGIEPFNIWGNEYVVGGYDGAIDELRVSSSARDPSLYFTAPLNVDSETLLLRHFNGKIDE